MKYFEITYLLKGKKYKKIIQSSNKVDALTMAKLNNPGIIVKVLEVATPAEERLNELKNKISHAIMKTKIKMPDLIAAFRQLSVMTNAGISIHDSIKEVAKATQNKHLKEIFERVDDDLNAGSSFTESLIPFKSELGEVTIAMVELGESTGNMGESLLKLSEIQEEIHDNKQKFKKAIRYPITVIIAICAAFSVLMIFVVPKFKAIFDKFQAELPLPTRILLGTEEILSNHGVLVLVIIIAIIVGLRFMYANNQETKDFIDKHIFKVYLIGKIVFYSSLSRFQLVFTELVHAGIPIAEALDTSLLTITNTHLKQKLSGVKISVQRGISLTDAFRETGLYEGMLIQMILAGEQSGNLDQMLGKVTEYFKSKFSDIIDNISSYIEPILLAFIAGIVLLMALGIFMPMWDIAKAVK